jgi:amino acid transporter
MIKKPNKNIFFAIFGSFLFVTVIYILFQAILFGVLGQEIFSAGEPLTLLANKIFYNPLVGQLITTCVFTSVIAGSFGMLTSNCWNLHTLAKEKHLPAEKFLSKLSKKDVPWASLLFEGAIACLLLVISKNQIALQSMSVFGVVFSFVLTAIAAYRATKQKQLAIKPIIPILSIASCFYILTLCFGKIVHAGISIPYIALLASGIAVSFTKKQLFKKFFS